MLTVKDKQVVVGADFAGHPLKEAVKAHLEERGWTVTDLTPDAESAPMYHRVGFALGAQIAEGKFERALAFCGTGMGMSLVANKFDGIYAACVESVYGAKMCRAINNANILTMGGWIIGPEMGVEMVKAFLNTGFTQDLEPWRAEFLTKAFDIVKGMDTK